MKTKEYRISWTWNNINLSRKVGLNNFPSNERGRSPNLITSFLFKHFSILFKDVDVDNEEVYKMANVMSQCGGLAVMLNR